MNVERTSIEGMGWYVITLSLYMQLSVAVEHVNTRLQHNMRKNPLLSVMLIIICVEDDD